MDLVIKSNELLENIKILEKDNLEIIDILEKIYKQIKDLDETKWNSREKKKIEEELLPYIKFNTAFYYVSFNGFIKVLNNALNEYLKKDEELKNKIT